MTTPDQRKRCDESSWYQLTAILPAVKVDVVCATLWSAGAAGIITADSLDPDFRVSDPAYQFIRAYFQLPENAAQAQTDLNDLVHDDLKDDLEAGDHCISLSWSVWEAEEEHSWQQYHVPLEVGQIFLFCPPWDVQLKPPRTTIVLKPAMAFGTGQHPTTRLLLRFLEQQSFVGVKRFLDCGTGSGILALAVAHLGAPAIYTLDPDPVALAAVRENVGLNSLTSPFQQVRGLATCFKKKSFDLITANLDFENVCRDGQTILALLRAGGQCSFSGLLVEEAAQISAFFSEAGYQLSWQDSLDGWAAFSVTAPGRSPSGCEK